MFFIDYIIHFILQIQSKFSENLELFPVVNSWKLINISNYITIRFVCKILTRKYILHMESMQIIWHLIEYTKENIAFRNEISKFSIDILCFSKNYKVII